MKLTTTKKALVKSTRASVTRQAVAICALTMACTPVFAQKGFDFGLKGNIQTTSLINSNDQAAGTELDYKNYTTMALGVSAGYSFNNHTGVEINILSSKQGQGYVGETSQINGNSGLILSGLFASFALAQGIPFTGNYTARITTNVIKVPILFRYTGNTTKKVYFSSFIGPQINILSKVKFTINDQDVSFSGSGNKPEDLYKKTTFDVAFGFGAGFNLSKNINLSVHLRLDYGLGDMEDKSFIPSGASDKFWPAGRASTHNATGGGLISLNYKLIKKAPAAATKTTPAAKPVAAPVKTKK